MLPQNTEIRLGNKAFLLILQKKLVGPVLMVIVIILIRSLHDSIVSAVLGILKLSRQVTPSTINAVSLNVSYFISVLFALAVLFLLIEFFISWLEYKNFTFKFEEFGLSIKKGIVDSKTVSVPYRQIQSVSIDRSLDQRFFGLSKITLTTAGHSENGDSVVILEPIDEELADEIRQKLQREIGVQVIEREQEADKETKQE